MTQDELKDKLKKQHDYWTNLVHYTKPEFYENTVDQRNGWSALLAVVELHKSQDITLPNGEWGVNCSYCDILTYPCPTLEAIEKELK